MSRSPRRWQLQEAKARLSELVRLAQESGPQTITVRGKNLVVVIARNEYERMKVRPLGFWEFMRASPLTGVELDLVRRRSRPRGMRW